MLHPAPKRRSRLRRRPRPRPRVPPDVKVSKKFIIVDHAEGATPDDPKLHTRTIERDGKTIIFKTSKPLSDAEIEEKIAKAEASMADAEAMVEGGKNGTRSVVIVKHGDGKDGEKTEISGSETRTIVMTRAGHGAGHSAAIALDGDAPEAIVCANGGETSNVAAEENKDGQRRVVKMRFCSHGGSQAMALDAIKKARDKMSTNSELSGEIRAKVLEALDREIERLSRTS
jgi:hypothetical protein